MESNANKDGKMTPDRVDAIKIFLRGVEANGGIPDKAAVSQEKAKKPVLSKDEAKKLGLELITELKKLDANLNTIKELLSEGADINAQNDTGMTALMWASSWGNGEVIEILLRGGTDVNLRKWDGSTALMYASADDHEEAVKTLLNHGASVDCRSANGKDAISYAKTESTRKLLVDALHKESAW